MSIQYSGPLDTVATVSELELAIAGPLGGGWERLDFWPILEEPLDFVVHREHRLVRVNNLGQAQLG